MLKKSRRQGCGWKLLRGGGRKPELHLKRNNILVNGGSSGTSLGLSYIWTDWIIWSSDETSSERLKVYGARKNLKKLCVTVRGSAFTLPRTLQFSDQRGVPPKTTERPGESVLNNSAGQRKQG